MPRWTTSDCRHAPGGSIDLARRSMNRCIAIHPAYDSARTMLNIYREVGSEHDRPQQR